jgi:hypothetical protein
MQLVHDVPHVLELMSKDDGDYLDADARPPRYRATDPDQEQMVNEIVRWDGKPMRVGSFTANQVSEYLLPAHEARIKNCTRWWRRSPLGAAKRQNSFSWTTLQKPSSR